MKKIICIALLLAMPFFADAQQVLLGTCDFYGNGPQKINYVFMEGGNTIWIPVEGDKNNSVVYLIIDEKDIPMWQSGMKELLRKYMEWKQVAINNNVKDFVKEFPFYFKYKVLWKKSSALMTPPMEQHPTFNVQTLKDGRINCYAALHGELKDANNKRNNESYYWILSREEEILIMSDILSQENINRKLSGQTSPDDLFR